MIRRLTVMVVLGLFAGALIAGGVANAQSDEAQSDEKGKMEMKKPEMVVISGVLADMTCAAKGQLMGSEHNAKNDTHMTPDGPKKRCATMCLKGGLPAGLYSDGKISAALLADASKNLYKFAAEEVEIQGYWAGEKDNDVKTFVPAEIRSKGSEKWTKVETGGMH